MTTFVLVHGAWVGGWCWQKVIPFLEAAGHEVYAPTLTGLAERASELSPDVGLDTHIQDVVGLITEKNPSQPPGSMPSLTSFKRCLTIPLRRCCSRWP